MNITPISTYLKRFLSFSDSSIPSQQHISDIKNYTLTQDVFSLKSSNDCKSSQTVYDIRTQLPSKCVLDDKISELESALRNNPDFADNKHREFISNPLGRELASTMILSDPDLQIQITEKMFGEVSKSSINSMLSMLQSHERELSNQVLCSFDSVMVEKAKTIGLTDTEKLLSIRYEQIDFASHATFNDKMASVLQDIKEAFDKEGLSFDSSKYFQFYLNTETFTFSVSGGTEKENDLIEQVVNTTNILGHSYETDHKGTILNAILYHRQDDNSYNPWSVDSIHLSSSIKENELKKHGIANISPNYSKKISMLSAAYRRYCLDQRLQNEYGFGINDLVYLGGENITGKNQEVTESIQKDYNLFMKTKGYTYIDLLREYQGTPSFSSPIFTFDDGKFNMTYTTN